MEQLVTLIKVTALAGMGGTGLGGIIGALFKRDSVKTVSLLLSFAAGVMIAASVWSLLIPSMSMASEQNIASWFPASLGFIIGIFATKL